MYEIEDVIERSMIYKYTFTVPSQQQIKSLKVGDLVKLIFREDYEDVYYDNQSVINIEPNKMASSTATLTASNLYNNNSIYSSSPNLQSSSLKTSNLNNNSNNICNNSNNNLSKSKDKISSPKTPSPNLFNGTGAPAFGNGNGATAASSSGNSTAERMWVKITGIDDLHQCFEGTLDNTPYMMKSIMKGDPLVFRANQILMIYGQNNQISYLSDEQKILTSQFCLVSKAAMTGKNNVGYIFREDPSKAIANDSGWRIFQGDESDEYMENKSNYQTCILAAVLNHDDSFLHLLQFPNDSYFEKDTKSSVWKRIKV